MSCRTRRRRRCTTCMTGVKPCTPKWRWQPSYGMALAWHRRRIRTSRARRCSNTSLNLSLHCGTAQRANYDANGCIEWDFSEQGAVVSEELLYVDAAYRRCPGKCPESSCAGGSCRLEARRTDGNSVTIEFQDEQGLARGFAAAGGWRHRVRLPVKRALSQARKAGLERGMADRCVPASPHLGRAPPHRGLGGAATVH